MISTILENTVGEREGKRRIVFTHTDDNGVVHGAFVEHRPIDDDIDAFLVGHAAALLNDEVEPE